MGDEKKYHEMYNKLVGYEKEIHEKNQKRINIGIKCIYVIPLVFLILLFLTESNKIVFLTLWIASLFCIATYLIWIEFTDYELQKTMNEISGKTENEFEGLLSNDNVTMVEDCLMAAQEKVEQRITEATEKVYEKKVAVQEKWDKRRNSDD